MAKLNELDKEYIALCTKDSTEDYLQEDIDSCLRRIKERGNIISKKIDYRGFPAFTFKDGAVSTIAPRSYKFTGPLIPPGMPNPGLNP